MRLHSTLSWILLLAFVTGCRSVPPSVVVPSIPDQSSTGVTQDFSHEMTPETSESLEVATYAERAPVTVSASGTIIIGSLTAPRLRIVTDPSCPYCQEFTLGDQLWLEQMYVSLGTLALEIVYLPLDEIGALNAKALLCSAEQGLFVTMEHSVAVDALQSEAEALTRAKSLRLPLKAFTSCLRSKKIVSILTTHQVVADQLQVTRVPAFALGAERWMGLESRLRVQEMIERAL